MPERAYVGESLNLSQLCRKKDKTLARCVTTLVCISVYHKLYIYNNNNNDLKLNYAGRPSLTTRNIIYCSIRKLTSGVQLVLNFRTC